MTQPDQIAALEKLRESTKNSSRHNLLRGLCGEIEFPVDQNGDVKTSLISFEEEQFLKGLLFMNQPPKEEHYGSYYWKPGEVKPRLSWIDDRIKEIQQS